MRKNREPTYYPVPGFYAEVTADGSKVYSSYAGRLISITERKGYKVCRVRKIDDPTKEYHIGVHKLVALALVPNDDPEHKTVVDHKNGNKHRNCAGNLEWVTQKENVRRAVAMGNDPWTKRRNANGSRKLQKDNSD